MADTKPAVEKVDDDDKSEVLGNLVKVVVLIWSASLLTSGRSVTWLGWRAGS